MTRDVAFMMDLWELIIPFVAPAERKNLAYSLVELADEHGFSDGFEDDDFTGYLSKAVNDFYRVDDNDDDDFEEDDDDDYR